MSFGNIPDPDNEGLTRNFYRNVLPQAGRFFFNACFQINIRSLFAIIHLFLATKTIKMDQPPAQPNQLNIEISEEVAEGTYANLAIITHSHAEFVIDFVNVMPGTPKSKVKSRIIFTPQHAKRFMKAMTENIQKYETVNGPIKDLEEFQLPLNFGPAGQA
jgi:hypothetical protein